MTTFVIPAHVQEELVEICVRAPAMQLGKAHCKPKPILLKIAQNLEGVHQILLKNGKILPHSL